MAINSKPQDWLKNFDGGSLLSGWGGRIKGNFRVEGQLENSSNVTSFDLSSTSTSSNFHFDY
jgi:hypothetical protein